MKKEITVTQALAELKLFDKRINKLSELSIVGYKVGSTAKFDFSETNAKSIFDSLKDLIKNRASLKMAINESNIKTKVKIADVKMTVLDAIEMKSGTIKYKKRVLSNLQTHWDNIRTNIEYENDECKSRLDTQVRSAFEKASKKDIDDFTLTFNKNNKAVIIDPLGIEKIIKELDESIDNFEAEVDFVLSTSNATTLVKIG